MTLEIEYFRWADEGKLVDERATLRVAGIVPMRGVAADRRLSPEYPGVTESATVADWDPPFPIDLKLVRPVDEQYWDRHPRDAESVHSARTGAAAVAHAIRRRDVGTHRTGSR